MRIARVFPTKTNMCPTDKDAYFDTPDMFTPKDYDEVHISVTFSWDIERADKLMEAWKYHGNVIKVDGVALSGESEKPFKAGMYLKHGVTITSRGCPNDCSFCIARKGLIEFDDFPAGNIIQDNNLLACSNHHLDLVWTMLKRQKGIEFRGGIESQRVTPKIAEQMRGLSIKKIWLACDYDAALKPLKKAVEIFKRAGFTRNHLYCYVLIGKEERRLREVYNIGCMPFAQLYQENTTYQTQYTKPMKDFARLFSRPAATRSICGTQSSQ